MDEFLVNQSTAGNQSQPSVAGFRGTQFVAVWEDQGTETIKGRLFGVNGAPSDKEFAVNFPTPPGTKRQLPTVIETAQGFAVTWLERPPGGLPQLKLRTFDEDTLSGPESAVSTAEPEPLIRPAMTRLTDGGFAVAWADKRADERIRLQRFGLDGSKNGSEMRANTAPGLHREPMVAGLTNANIVVGWRARITSPAAPSPANFWRKRPRRRRADIEYRNHGRQHGVAQFRAICHRACAECGRQRDPASRQR